MDTKFKGELLDKFKGKGLTESSIKLYLRNLEKLNDDMPLKNLKFLDDSEGIISKLKDYKPNTRRGYLISIVTTLGCFKSESKKMDSLYKKYYDAMIKIAKEIKSKPTDELTEAQKENWISWDKVKEIYDTKKEQVYKFIDNKEINENQYNILLSYVVLSLYYFSPPRRNKDYQLMNIVKKYSDDMPSDKNYLSYDDDEFIFNVFKTSKKEGQVKIKYNDDLKKVITQYMKFHPLVKGKKLAKNMSVSFLVYFDGKPFTSVNSITRILNKLFGCNVGSSMLRHIFLTDKYGSTLKEQQKDSKLMSHSISTQKDYIKDDGEV